MTYAYDMYKGRDIFISQILFLNNYSNLFFFNSPSYSFDVEFDDVLRKGAPHNFAHVYYCLPLTRTKNLLLLNYLA